MAVKIDGMVHQSPARSPWLEQHITYCGLPYDPATTYRTWQIECIECRRVGALEHAKPPVLSPSDPCRCEHPREEHRPIADGSDVCDGDPAEGRDVCDCAGFRQRRGPRAAASPSR